MPKSHNEQYKDLGYWRKQYYASVLQNSRQDKQKPVLFNTCAETHHNDYKQKKSKTKILQKSVSSQSQSSLSSFRSHKNHKHCCDRKKRLVEQSYQIQRLKYKKKQQAKQRNRLLIEEHSCGYKLSQCPFIQNYLKKISNRLQNQNQNLKFLQKQNKQLVKQNRFFNQYYQTFQKKVKRIPDQRHFKSKISIKCQKSLKPRFEQTDYCTFRKMNYSPNNSKVKNCYQEGYQSQKYCQNEQPSQITRSSYHKKQNQSLHGKIKNFNNGHDHKKNSNLNK